MKKLLSILGAVTLTAAPLGSVVSCKTDAPDSNLTKPENQGQDLKLTNEFNTAFKTATDVKQQELNGRPLGKYWMPEGGSAAWFPNMKDQKDGLFNFYDYDISQDKDAKYNRATVKLKKKINTLGSNQFQDKTGQVKNIVMGVMNRTTSGTAAQGNSVFNNYNFTNWQYVDVYAAWAGSNGEGIIVLPTPDIIDAAHMNGTRVLGMIYFDGFWGLQDNPDLIKHFFDKEADGETYKVVDKLIEVADYFGFDGWFWNDEANARRPEDGKPPAIIAPDDDVIGVMQQYRNKVEAKNLDLLMASYSNQTALIPVKGWEKEKLAKRFVENSDYFIQDYGKFGEATGEWFDQHPELKDKQFNVSSMPNLGEWYTGGEEFATDDLSGYIGKKDETKGTVTAGNSLSIFALADTAKWGERDAMYGKPLNINHYFRQNDNLVYAGLEMDPSKVGTTGWNNHGVANYILEKSTYSEPEFLTNFSTGQGISYFVDGQQIKTNADWNMRGVIDQMPTYQWIVKNEGGNGLFADYDYTKGWQKGNSIALKSAKWNDESSKYDGGKIFEGGKTTIDLLGSEIKVENQKLGMKLAATGNDQKDLIANNGIEAKFVLTFADETQKTVGGKAVKASENGDWYSIETDLSEFKDQVLRDVSLEFTSNVEQTDVSINIGEISLLKKTDKQLTNLENFKVEYLINKDSTTKNLRVYWDKKDTDFDRYEFYQLDEKGNRVFLGTTRTNAYFIEDFAQKNGNKLVVRLVSNLDPTKTLESTFAI